jgi:8-oxo-dGTP pyrophosphatase MutT (NUDIX family)
MNPAGDKSEETHDKDHLTRRLRERLSQPLPGPAVMRAMSVQLAYGRHFMPPPHDARQAAVAVLVYPHAGLWYTPLTLRQAHLREHSGQVSFPGGSLETGESAEAGAWRELEEELGIGVDGMEPLGRMTPLYIYGSNFHVTPCLAVAKVRPVFRPSELEVAEVLEWPLDVLHDPAARGEMWIERRQVRFRANCWEYAGRRVWGASALILAELAALLRGEREA